METKISVCMATYNGLAFVENAINSILKQLSEGDELLIIDDCSTDGTWEFINSLKNEKIRLIRNKKNIGVGNNFCKGLGECKGDLVFLADQDDVWSENKIDFIKSYFRQNREVDLIVHNAEIELNGELLRETIFDLNKSRTGFFKNMKNNAFMGCCMVLRKEALNSIIPKIKITPFYHDHYFGLMATLQQKNIVFLPGKLLRFIRHDSNVSLLNKRRNIFNVILDRGILVLMLCVNFFLKSK